MKKFIVVFALSLLTGQVHSQNYGWITPNKDYLKLAVIEDGMYRISRTDFTNAGINTASIDPRTVKVYYKGSEIPVFFQGESDGTFDASDYLDFYGIRSYGGPTNYYTIDNAVYYTKDEYINMYSDTNYYWIGWDGSNGLRYIDYGFLSDTSYSPNYVFERVHSEKDKVYSMGERADANDFRNFNNELFQGEGWYWQHMTNGQIISDTFNVPIADTLDKTCTFRFFAYPYIINSSVYNEHKLELLINNTVVAVIYKDNFGRFDSTLTFSSSILKKSSTNNFYYKYVTDAPGCQLSLDFGDLRYPKLFILRNNYFRGELESDTVTKKIQLTGYVPANPMFIYDVKNGYKITDFSNSGDTLTFSAKGNAKLEVYNKNLTKKPYKITKRKVPDFVSSTNGADYILVYNSIFEAQAEQLKNHRETQDNYRFTKAEIQDVYDVFNYGLQEPVAIRNFTRYAYNNWELPKLKFICLLGRGSLDPKKNISSSTYYKNLIPVAGNPSSDNYFANFNTAGFTYWPMVGIGRLPAFTSQEAQDMVNNIITYETVTPALWWKNHTFIIGGGTIYDQQSFQSIMNPIINNQIIPPALSGNVIRIFRNDTSTSVTYNYKDSVRKNINSGSMVVNFIGHAGYENWEDAMQEPSTLENYGKLSLVLSMTCYTGKTGVPNARSFGEKFVTMANRGAIGFVGTTGWGWFYSQSIMQNWLLSGVAKDTIRQIGEVLKNGLNKVKQDSLSSSVRHTVNCYNLLGDPAIKFNTPLQPDYAIVESDYKLSNTYPALFDKLTLTIYPKNYGLYADSCKIRFNLKKNLTTVKTFDTVVYAFELYDTVRFNFELDSIDNHSVQVILDVDNWEPNEYKNNNSITIKIPIMNLSYVTMKPLNNSVVRTDSVEFAGLNPVSNNLNNNVKVILEFDTTQYFNSPLKRTFVRNDVNDVITKFKTDIPVLIPGMIYYWRTNALINTDSTGWTNYQTFIYHPTALANATKSFGNNLLEDSANTILKIGGNQYPSTDLYKISYVNSGLQMNTYPLTLLVTSFGNNGAEMSSFTVNDKNVNVDGGRDPGLNMIKVKKLDGHILDIKNVRMTNSLSNDTVINFLNTFDTTHYLMALNASYVAYNQVVVMNSAAKQKIRDFGSTKIDSLQKFGQFDTWSFIGSLGAGPSDVSEQYYKYSSGVGWRPANSSKSSIIKETYGYANNVIGPAEQWTNFSWEQTLNHLSAISFDVFGMDRNGNQTLLMNNVTSNSLVELDTVNSYLYPFLNLQTKISIDTNYGFTSSQLNSLKANYTLPSELVFDIHSFKISDTLVTTGSEVKVYFDYHSAGYKDIEGVIVNIYKTSPSPGILIKSDTINKLIKIDSSANYYAKFKVPYHRPGSDNKIPVLIEIKPLGETNELYTFNNSLEFNLTINYQQLPVSAVEFYSDGKIVRSGDYVRKEPELKISFSKTGLLADNIVESSDITVKINDKVIPVGLNAKQYSDVKSKIAKQNIAPFLNDGSLAFNPVLESGENTISVIYKADADKFDTASVDLVVDENLSVKELYNFPNPLRDKTSFYFNLTGGVNPTSCKIKIYTSSGRQIREIKFSSVIGYNQIEWDGKDEDGDAIANGTYLYKIIMDDEAKTETQVQKLVVLK
ncbi:MAG: hypothetical protein HGGPFJEG_02357 [Ignavibacteria bacterium]|nr:hypothetical protein [Ignavibacteria bacterium]